MLNETYDVGYWENGKLEGVVKCFIGKAINYAIWSDGKKERVFMDEQELRCKSDFDLRDYKNIFKLDISLVKHYLEATDQDE